LTRVVYARSWRRQSPRQELGELAVQVLVQDTLELLYALVLVVEAA
jgi:hypothetical protein